MRLLILMQTVDKKDSALGFYHDWILELAKHFEKITIFALKTGEYAFPEHVTIIPLRPWGYRARLRTALRVLSLAWNYRREYDAVFVHMNQEYLLVAGWLWKLLGKPMYFWRNHYDGTFLTDIAAAFCTTIFYTSKSSYTAKYKQAKQMPVGVSVSSCHLDEPIAVVPRSVLFLGRFDISKRPGLVVAALAKVAAQGIEFSATFVGGPSDPESALPAEVAAQAEKLGIADKISFVGPIPNTDTYKYYRSHSIYVNCGRSGMLDKSLFKSIACGCLPLFSSADMAEIAGKEYAYVDNDADDLAKHLVWALTLPEEERQKRVSELNEKAVEGHTLQTLGEALAHEIRA